MKIDRSNYEEFMADYLDGNLKGDALQALEDFLEKNPGLSPDQELSRKYYLTPEEQDLEKNNLLRSYDDIPQINSQNFEELQRKLLVFADSNANYKKMLALYKEMHFKPDTAIVFHSKSGLFRQRVPRTLYYSVAGLAAAAVVLFMLVTGRNNPQHPDHRQSAIVNNSREKTPESSTLDKVQEEKKPEKIIRSSFIKETSPAGNAPVQLATFDTSDERKQEKVVIARLQPIGPEIPEMVLPPTPGLKIRSFQKENEETQGVKKIVGKVEEQYYAIKSSKLSLAWQAVHAGITGINKMTENDIELHTTTDQKGKVTEFALGNGKFEITKKIKKNEQN